MGRPEMPFGNGPSAVSSGNFALLAVPVSIAGGGCCALVGAISRAKTTKQRAARREETGFLLGLAFRQCSGCRHPVQRSLIFQPPCAVLALVGFHQGAVFRP